MCDLNESIDLGPRKQYLRMSANIQTHCGLAQGMDTGPDKAAPKRCEGRRLEDRPVVFGLKENPKGEGGQGSYQCGCSRSHMYIYIYIECCRGRGGGIVADLAVPSLDS